MRGQESERRAYARRFGMLVLADSVMNMGRICATAYAGKLSVHNAALAQQLGEHFRLFGHRLAPDDPRDTGYYYGTCKARKERLAGTIGSYMAKLEKQGYKL